MEQTTNHTTIAVDLRTYGRAVAAVVSSAPQRRVVRAVRAADVVAVAMEMSGESSLTSRCHGVTAVRAAVTILCKHDRYALIPECGRPSLDELKDILNVRSHASLSAYLSAARDIMGDAGATEGGAGCVEAKPWWPLTRTLVEGIRRRMGVDDAAAAAVPKENHSNG